MASAETKITPKPLPEEHDYLWERAKLRSKPARVHYRDLPIVSTQTFDDVGATRAALLQLEQGQFTAAAQLCDGSSRNATSASRTMYWVLHGWPLAACGLSTELLRPAASLRVGALPAAQKEKRE